MVQRQWIFVALFMFLGFLTPRTVPAQSMEGIQVTEAALCERVEARECIPLNPPEGKVPDTVGNVCLFTRVQSDTDAATYHVWYHEDVLQQMGMTEDQLVGQFRTLFQEKESMGGSVNVKVPGHEAYTFGIRLDVQSSSGYRTWSCKTIVPDHHRGNWSARVLDAGGNVHHSLSFDVVQVP